MSQRRAKFGCKTDQDCDTNKGFSCNKQKNVCEQVQSVASPLTDKIIKEIDGLPNSELNKTMNTDLSNNIDTLTVSLKADYGDEYQRFVTNTMNPLSPLISDVLYKISFNYSKNTINRIYSDLYELSTKR